jgi:hypothetical protein
VGLGEWVCVVCGSVWSWFGRVNVCVVWDTLEWVGGVNVCCVWDTLEWVGGIECVLCVGQVSVGLGG